MCLCDYCEIKPCKLRPTEKERRTVEVIDCPYYKNSKPTNADRIRSMTAEELADEFMTRLVLCQYCEYQNECENAEDVAAYKCREGIVKWLKQPAEGE